MMSLLLYITLNSLVSMGSSLGSLRSVGRRRTVMSGATRSRNVHISVRVCWNRGRGHNIFWHLKFNIVVYTIIGSNM